MAHKKANALYEGFHTEVNALQTAMLKAADNALRESREARSAGLKEVADYKFAIHQDQRRMAELVGTFRGSLVELAAEVGI